MADLPYHSDACQAAQRAAVEFDAKYPNHCRSCGGAGAWYDPGVRYLRDGSGTPPDGGPCGACVDAMRCPLCAETIETREVNFCDYGRCAACGWDEHAIASGKAPLVARPEVDCCCFLDETCDEETP